MQVLLISLVGTSIQGLFQIGGERMNAIKETPEIKKSIDEHKKFLDKTQLFNFGFQNNGQTYLHVRYSKFDKATGLLILDEKGRKVDHNAAKEAVYYFNFYNTTIHGVISEMIPEMRKSMDTLKESVQILNRLKDEPVLQDEDFKQHLNTYLQNLTKYLEDRTRIEDCVMTIRDIQEEQKKKGYFTMEDYRKADASLQEYNKILYRGGRIMLESKDSATYILSVIERNLDRIQAKKEAGKLVKWTKTYLSGSTLGGFEKSMRTFEKDSEGNKRTFSEGEAGIQEMIDNNEKVQQAEFERSIVPLIRN